MPPRGERVVLKKNRGASSLGGLTLKWVILRLDLVMSGVCCSSQWQDLRSPRSPPEVSVVLGQQAETELTSAPRYYE